MRILQCLNWNIKDIEENLDKIAEQGFDTIQINPVQPLKEDNKDNWWLSYQPCGFSIGNQYGSKEDLIKLCEMAGVYNIKIIVDVILTHMAQEKEMIPHPRVDQKLTDNQYFWREKKNLQGDWDYNNRYNVTHYCAGNLPGLNLYNWDLQDMISDFLNELTDCGVAGFRIDSGKSIPLPSDYFENTKLTDARPCDFFPRIISKLKDNPIIYIEVLNVAPDLIKKYTNYGLVLTELEYENVFKDSLVSFAESHDQYYNWRPNIISPLSDEQINNWYETKVRNYPNTLYYARPFSNAWKDEKIKKIHHQTK